MNPERWQHVKQILDEVLEQPPSERGATLARLCGGDEELRAEVESLLEAHESADAGFLADVTPEVERLTGKRQPESREEDHTTQEHVGIQVGAWRLEREIGRGGMGIVYLGARADSEFRKRVAVKLIRREVANDFAIRRFRNERQILATLEHPNIARLIDGGTTEDGLPYFVMEYVEGEPLLRYCEARALPNEQRLALFLDVCAAVQYAHRRMIVHRDLKPGNVLVKKDGTPKLLDFGIAKLLEPDTTDNSPETTLVGMRMVTPAYASPEQLRGEQASVRSDIYSLGVILCELLAGCKPDALERRTTSQGGGGIAAVPAPAAKLEPDLHSIVTRSTRYSPDERYGSVEELITDVRRYLEGAPVPHYAAEWTAGEGRHAEPGSIAILPFRLLDKDTGSDAYLATGLTDTVITRLSGVGRIAVRPTSAVLPYAGSRDAVAAGRELNVEYVLEGAIHRAGDRVRVTVQLVRVATGSPAWGASFVEPAEDLLRLEDSISGQVAEALIPQLTGEEQEVLARRGTRDRRAHEAYLRGRWHWSSHTEEGLASALMYFSRAIDLDPEYAQAHAGIADYYVLLGLRGGLPPAESFAAAKQASQRALKIDPSLAEAHASFGVALWAYDRDYAQAAHHLQLAITINPDYATAHQWFGMLNSARGRPEIAIASLERARKLEPRSPAMAASLARAYINSGQAQKAADDLRNPARLPDEHAVVEELTAWAFLKLGQPEQARAAAVRAVQLERGVFSLAALAAAEAARGDHQAASTVLQEVQRTAGNQYVSSYWIASIMLSCGDRAGALAMLQKAWDERDWWVMWLVVDPRWEPLRDDPEFRRMAGLKPGRERVYAPQTTSWSYKYEKPRPRRKGWIFAAAAVVTLFALVFAAFRLWQPRSVFSSVEITRITTNGTAIRAALSPDGKTVAYAVLEEGSAVIYVRPLDSPTTTRVAGPLEGELTSLQFTGNGEFIAWTAQPPTEPGQAALYRVPVAGGPVWKGVTGLPGPASFRGDGQRVAWLRPNPAERADELYVARPDGSGAELLVRRRYPDRFAMSSPPAWSADGRYLACPIAGADAKGPYTKVSLLDAETREMRIVEQPRWQYIERLAWLGEDTVLVTGQVADSAFQQVWLVPLNATARRVSNDLNNYAGVSAAAGAIVSVQHQVLSNLYIARAGEDLSRGAQITPGAGRYFDVIWTPDRRLLYVSDASGSAEVWSMNADGTGERRLTQGPGRSYVPSASPDGRSIAFHSNRSGNWNIWRADSDGGNPAQLTFGARESDWPDFSPDSRFVYYRHLEEQGTRNIYRVPAAGGTPERLTDRLANRPTVFRGDGRIACWYSEQIAPPKWTIALLGPDGGAPLRTFSVPPTVAPGSILRWTPQGDGIAFVERSRGVWNIWVQPVDGSPARPLTHFTWGEVYAFDWSRNRELVYSRGLSTRDVIVFRDSGK